MRSLAIVFALLVAALAGFLYAVDVAADRRYVVEVMSPESVYELPPHEYLGFNPVIDTLQPNQSLSVLRVRYGKDFEALKIQGPNGKPGWVITGGGVRVLSRG